MAVNQMSKVYLLIPRQNKEKLLKELQKAGFIHVETDLIEEIHEDKGIMEVTGQDVELKISKVEYVLDNLKKYEKQPDLKQQLQEMGKFITYEEFQNLYDEEKLNTIYEETYKLLSREKSLNSEENEIKARMARLEPYKQTEFKFGELKNTANSKMKIGTIPVELYNDFRLELDKITDSYEIRVISEDYKGICYFYIAYHKEFQEPIEKLMVRKNFHEEIFAEPESVREILDISSERLEKIAKEKEIVKTGNIELSNSLDRMKLIHDYLLNTKERKKVEDYIFETPTVAVLKGWIKKQDREKLEKLTGEASPEFEIVEKEPDENDKIPIEMTNPGYLSPMEFVTSLYGMPKYKEYDPTAYIFPFFVFFFAVCLTDAGYGIMLLITSLVLMKIMGKSKLLTVIMYGSAFTILVGFVTGGFWGIDFQKVKSVMPEFWQKYMFDVNENALQFLVFTIFLGIIQLIFAFFLGAKQSMERKDYKDAVEKILKGLFFGTGAPVVVMSSLMNKSLPAPLDKLFPEISLISLALYIIYQLAYNLKNTKFTGSALQMLGTFIVVTVKSVVMDGALSMATNITGFMGNMLSYSRLMALGLATGGIGMVVNLMAQLVKQLLPGELSAIAVVISVIILVFGHIFNMTISTLGAFIHTARLQYVEFFPSFFEGGGRKFAPLAIKTKHNRVLVNN